MLGGLCHYWQIMGSNPRRSNLIWNQCLTLWVPAVFTGLMLGDGVGRVYSYLAASTSTIPLHWAVSTRYKFCCFQFWVEIGYVCLFTRLPKTSIHVVGTLRVKEKNEQLRLDSVTMPGHIIDGFVLVIFLNVDITLTMSINGFYFYSLHPVAILLERICISD